MAKYIVSVEDGSNAQTVSKEIETLAKKEGASLKLTNVFNNIGILALECSQTFAEKIKTLTGVKHVEADKPGFAI